MPDRPERRDGYTFCMEPYIYPVVVPTDDGQNCGFIEQLLCYGNIAGQTDPGDTQTRYALIMEPFFRSSDLDNLAKAASDIQPDLSRKVLEALGLFPWVTANEEGIVWTLPDPAEGDHIPLATITRSRRFIYNPEIFPDLRADGVQRSSLDNKFRHWLQRQNGSNRYSINLICGRINPRLLGDTIAQFGYELVASLHFSAASSVDMTAVMLSSYHANGFAPPNERRMRGIVNNVGRIIPNRLPDVVQ